MTQLEEAEAVIKNLMSRLHVDHPSEVRAREYWDKYHPKDLLFEKWMTLTEISAEKHLNIKAEFEKAKELGLFTMALDEAIYFLDDRLNHSGDMWKGIVKIREKYGN